MSRFVDKRLYMELLKKFDTVIKERGKLMEQVADLEEENHQQRVEDCSREYEKCCRERKAGREEVARLEGLLRRSSPFDYRAADRMAAAIDHMIACRCLDARSPAADARLDYGEPFEAELAKEMFFDCKPAPKRKRIAELEEELEQRGGECSALLEANTGFMRQRDTALAEVARLREHCKTYDYWVSPDEHEAEVAQLRELLGEVDKWLYALWTRSKINGNEALAGKLLDLIQRVRKMANENVAT